jgi:hypothetical protein
MPSEEHIHEPESGDEDFGPIDAAERDALSQDLVDVKALKAVLSGRGVRGVVVFCPDCDEDHYLGWDLLAGNLQQILENGITPVHEPAWDPDPDEYVTWDYARGFLDGYESYPEDRSLDQTCAWCGSSLSGTFDWAYCPFCGKDFASVNLLVALRRQGWSNQRIEELFHECGLKLPVLDPAASPPVLPFDPKHRSE